MHMIVVYINEENLYLI